MVRDLSESTNCPRVRASGGRVAERRGYVAASLRDAFGDPPHPGHFAAADPLFAFGGVGLVRTRVPSSCVTPMNANSISSVVCSPNPTTAGGLFGLFGFFALLSKIASTCSLVPALSFSGSLNQ